MAHSNLKQSATPFAQLVKFLTDNEIQHQVRVRSQEIPFDVVLLALGMDDDNTPVTLQVHHYQQELVAPQEEGATQEPKSLGTLHILNFLMTHPTELKPESFNEINRLLMLANKSLPMGSLSMSELERCCYFQFGLPVTTEEVQPATFQSIFNTILFAKEVFFDVIKDVHEGRTTVDEIIQSSQAAMNQTAGN